MVAVAQISRFTIGLVWIYHGVFPKIYHIAPLELSMASALGFSDEQTLLLIKLAGICEILFGLIFILLYRNRSVVLVNIAGLLGLMVYVAVYSPPYLIHAFNPVTTNLPVVALSIILIYVDRERYVSLVSALCSPRGKQ